MEAFLDTSVLVPCFFAEHEHHEPSRRLLETLSPKTGCCSAHTLVEVYATITRIPGKNRVELDEARLFLGSVRDLLTSVALTQDEYWRVIESSVENGVRGGTTYDAILVASALKSEARFIYTWNVRHFERFGTEVRGRLRLPGSS